MINYQITAGLVMGPQTSPHKILGIIIKSIIVMQLHPGQEIVKLFATLVTHGHNFTPKVTQGEPQMK